MAQNRDSKLIRAEFKDAHIDDPTVNEILVDADRAVGDPLDPLEEKDEFRRRSYFQHVGFYSLPRSDIADQMIFLRSDNTYIAIASEGLKIYKPLLHDEGDTAIYSDGGTWVATLADGTVKCQANALSIILMEPDGTITLQNQKGTIEITPAGAITIAGDGDILINNVNGLIQMSTDGTVDINNGNLTVDP